MQSNINSATFEHPGYVEIRQIDGSVIVIGDRAIEYYPDGDTGSQPAAWADFGDVFSVADVTAHQCEHGGGNVYADYVTLANGACIVVTTDGVYVYGNDDEARDPDWPPLLSLMFDGSAH